MALQRILEPEGMTADEEAEQYDLMDFSDTDQLFVDRTLQVGAGARLMLDMGAGNGKITTSIARRLEAAQRLCLVDLSVNMLRIAGRHMRAGGVTSPPVFRVAGDGKKLPFRTGIADLIVANSLVHHIPEPIALFREIVRVLRPGGPFLIRDLCRPESHVEVDRFISRYARGWSELQQRLFHDSLHAALTIPEVRDCLDRSGLAEASLHMVSDRHWSVEGFAPEPSLSGGEDA